MTKTPSKFRLPNLTQHVGVFGRNGSGKTRLAFWLLSKARFDKQPFIVLDWKGEELFTLTDRVRELKLTDALPKHPGVYIIRPLPGQDEIVEKWLWKVWANEKIGLYVDEGYSIDQRSEGLQAILTQGRSKRLPVIYLAQRPSWISRFVISEATFLSIFSLNDRFDRQRLQAVVPYERINLNNRLPEYHSYWYDVGQDADFVLAPVPSDDELLDEFDRRLAPRRKVT